MDIKKKLKKLLVGALVTATLLSSAYSLYLKGQTNKLSREQQKIVQTLEARNIPKDKLVYSLEIMSKIQQGLMDARRFMEKGDLYSSIHYIDISEKLLLKSDSSVFPVGESGNLKWGQLDPRYLKVSIFEIKQEIKSIVQKELKAGTKDRNILLTAKYLGLIKGEI